MIQKTFLGQKRAWGNPPVGRIMQRYLQGRWTWVLLPNQPPTDAVSWVSSHGLDGWDPKETAVVFWQGTGIWGEGHLCTHRPHNTWALFGFLSRRCEDEKKHSGRLGIFDLCWLILHQSCQGRTAQVCLDSFSASFCTKGKKYLFTHTQEPGWAMRLWSLGTRRPLRCAEITLSCETGKAQKNLKERAVPLSRYKKVWMNSGTSWGLFLEALTEEIPSLCGHGPRPPHMNHLLSPGSYQGHSE